MSDKINIAVIMGGMSTEHDISIITGNTILNALNKEKYNVFPILIKKSGKWSYFYDLEEFKTGVNSNSINKEEILAHEAIAYLLENNIQTVYIALHGRYGEDGTIQGLFDFVGIKYTGSGVMASAIAMDKVRTQGLLEHHGLKLPKCLRFEKDQSTDTDVIQISVEQNLGFPVVMKPVDGGSSAATFLIKTKDEIEEKLQKGFEVANSVMFQQYVKGDEVTCAILDIDGVPTPLPPTQIIPKTSDFFDFTAKYEKGASDEITPPRLPENIIQQIQEIALKAHQILGCEGISRTDMIVVGEEIYVLETNTVPGMTETSLYPQAAAKIGLSFSELLDKIIEHSLNKK